MVDNSVKHIIGAGALIYAQSSKRYLFLLRDGAKHSNNWAIPGGKINAAETPIQALKREIQEEIGEVCYHKIIPLEHFTSDNGKFEYHTYIIPVATEFVPTLNHEHKGYAWTRIEDHPKPLHPGVWRSFNFQSILAKIRTVEHVL